jgi:FixJ family two-component response regulator
MSSDDRTAYIVTGNALLRERLRESLANHGLPVVVFGAAGDYLRFPKPNGPACLLLDLHLPDMSGLQLQQRIASTHVPIVFIVDGAADVASSVRALKAGALDFLTWPVSCRELFHAVEGAIDVDRRATPERIRRAHLQEQYGRLTPREREVLLLVVSGFLNKQAARDLGISENTVQIHRRRVMRKMRARTLPDLVRMAEVLNVPCSRVRSASKSQESWSPPLQIDRTFGTADAC